MEKKDEFIRVGTTYYKIVDQPLINGDTVKRRIPSKPLGRTIARTSLQRFQDTMASVRFPTIASTIEK